MSLKLVLGEVVGQDIVMLLREHLRENRNRAVHEKQGTSDQLDFLHSKTDQIKMCGRLCLYVYQALIKWFYDAFIDKIKNIGTILLNILLQDLGKDGSSYFQITECWDEE